MGKIITVCDTVCLQWALSTHGIFSQAHAGAQVHQTLRVRLDMPTWQHGPGMPPQLIKHGSADDRTANAVIARQYAFHIAIEYGVTPAVGEYTDCRRRGTAYAGQRYDP